VFRRGVSLVRCIHLPKTGHICFLVTVYFTHHPIDPLVLPAKRKGLREKCGAVREKPFQGLPSLVCLNTVEEFFNGFDVATQKVQLPACFPAHAFVAFVSFFGKGQVAFPGLFAVGSGLFGKRALGIEPIDQALGLQTSFVQQPYICRIGDLLVYAYPCL